MNEKIIAFYAPLKPVGHVTPSGDRLMARLLVDCLSGAGYRVEVSSQLRAFLRDPESESDKTRLLQQADAEIERLSGLWEQRGAPQLWFCYHPYFKSPDLLGPPLCQRFNIPYVTAEASYSARRSQGIWSSTQELVLSSINQAAVNICFTDRDLAGLRQASASASLVKLAPFIDNSEISCQTGRRESSRLITVAMMRAGDKMNSYKRLAAALKQLVHVPWTLCVVGDGPLRDDVHELFSAIPANRIEWQGLLEPAQIAIELARSSLYVWPGCGEAYGLAYLEAQAAGVPVIAYNTAGVPEVVDHGHTGMLTTEGDDHEYASALRALLENPQQVKQFSDNAVAHVQLHHAKDSAISALQKLLQEYVGATDDD